MKNEETKYKVNIFLKIIYVYVFFLFGCIVFLFVLYDFILNKVYVNNPILFLLTVLYVIYIFIFFVKSHCCNCKYLMIKDNEIIAETKKEGTITITADSIDKIERYRYYLIKARDRYAYTTNEIKIYLKTGVVYNIFISNPNALFLRLINDIKLGSIIVEKFDSTLIIGYLLLALTIIICFSINLT